tara:strand:- start:684 stop:1547 length:864 start_codon:yes stop_codon:yes gene_type:complete
MDFQDLEEISTSQQNLDSKKIRGSIFTPLFLYTMKYLIILLFLPLTAFGYWGKTGHRVVGDIADKNLTETATQQIRELLDGQTLAEVSTWPDEMRSNPSFKPYDKWHYVNLPLDKNYMDVEHTQDNVVIIINRAIGILKDPTQSKETKQFYLKYLVHTVGDLHQPLHTGREEDYGGGKIQVSFMGRKDAPKPTNLHDLWDAGIIDDYKMSYTELSQSLRNKKTVDFEQGDAVVWANESHSYVGRIYETSLPESRLSYDYVYVNFPIVEQRLFQAGIRLSSILNDIFS